MTLKDLRDVLLGVTPAVYHYVAHKTDGEFVVWTEYSAVPVRADNRHVLKSWRVQVDAYSSDEYSSLPDDIAAAFTAAEIAYNEPAVSFDEETQLVRWRYDVTVVG